MKHLLFAALFSVLTITVPAQNPDMFISLGKKEKLHSKILGEERTYLVSLPGGYTNEKFQKTNYPVLYLLDAEVHFNSVSSVIEILSSGVNGSYVLPPMIVVGIINTNRSRDQTPTHVESTGGDFNPAFKASGGGDNFLKFLGDELIPHIDSTYRTMPYRVLVGHSSGGLMAIHALYKGAPFNAYISIEPSLWWDNQLLLQKAKEYFLQADLNGICLFLAQANALLPRSPDLLMTHHESIKTFATYLETRNPSGLDWKYQYYENDAHGSVAFVATYEGLRYIFRNHNPRLSSTPQQLKKQFEDLSNQLKTEFKPGEAAINSAGHAALSLLKNPELALEYFQLNSQYYPESANVHDTLGKYWMDKGEKEKAIQHYERSLKLNPANKKTEALIKSLKASAAPAINK
jgi:uncharacterized protein